MDASEIVNIKTLRDVLSYIDRHISSINKNETVEDSTSIKIEEDDIENSLNETKIGKTKSIELGRYALREVSSPNSGFSMSGLVHGCYIAVTDDGNGVAQILVERLKERGMNAYVVDDIPEHTEVLIFLGGLRNLTDEDSAIEVNREAFIVAKKIANRFASYGGVFITVQDTGGDFGLSGKAGLNVYTSGLTGLIKTAALEWPLASVKAIDIDRGNRSNHEVAKILIEELFAGGPEIEVGLHSDGIRTCLDSYQVTINKTEPVLNNESVIVASGGARGVTANTLIELARMFHPRIVLLGRTPITEEAQRYREALSDGEIKKVILEEAKVEGRTLTPIELGAEARQILANREIQSTILTLKKAGSDVRYFALDVQDVSALNNALETVRQEWGPISGIIHGAGVLNDKLIADKTPEQFDLVFKTKVEGLRSMLTAAANDSLRLICLFSSVAARYGNIGQSDYSMANEILNKIANAEASRRKGVCIVKSINWGPWDGGMVTPQLKAHFKELGVPLIPLDVGAQRFVEEVQEVETGRAEIVIGPAPPKRGLPVRTDQRLNLRLIVSQADYPFLDSHRIEDVPIVPVVMVLEWFLRAAHIYCPEMTLVACKDLRVLRGIRLEGYHNGADHLILSCYHENTRDGSMLTMELHGIEGPPHYTATVEMTLSSQGNGRDTANNFTNDLELWSWDTAKIYKDQLFHGPDFQVIRSLDGVSNNGASAVIAGTKEMDWPGYLWKSDAAALDGGLQLAILWGAYQLGNRSLPTKIGSYFSYLDGPAKGPIRCNLKGKLIGNEYTISDISFFDKDENLVAEMCGVEMHMLPDISSKM